MNDPVLNRPIAASSSAEPGATAPAASANSSLLLGLGLATGMEFYTFDSMNLVLPDLTGTLGVSADEASWLLTVYSCTLFLGVPVSVWLAGHVGYKRFLLATIWAYAVASIGCALAPGLDSMLFCRALQGLAGAGLVVWWRASIYVLMPKPQRSAALMRVSTVLYLSSAAGLLASGYITDRYDWRLIFLPNLLYAGGALWLLSRHFPSLPPAASGRVIETDWLGIALIAIALVSLQIILNRGEIDDWFGSAHLRLLAFAGAAAFIAFVAWQASTANRTPLLCLDLLRDRHVLSSAVLGVFTGMILSGSVFVLPEFLRNLADHTYSATQTGQIMCVYALCAAGLRPAVVGLVTRVGQRKTIAISLLMLLASMLVFHQLMTAGTPGPRFVLPLVLYACCLAPLLPSVGSGTVARIDQNKLLDGVSLYMTFRQFGASLGVALLTILIAHRETLHSSRLLEHVRSDSVTTRSWLSSMQTALVGHGGQTPFDAAQAAVHLLAHEAARQAATLAYADAFAFMAAIGVLALCALALVPPTPVQGK
ncbi:DHA2 family efflux MFS transporter permease subunit [Trinickia diaoshuihuensis]|uniref:DHA2 family efflux MFS transporter permease subunit n=1 Tax=Trinickia diaoshuihuensis TaxID=2292265 RepID=UPI001F07197B|nr:DHA2 family efflux MFS transporter permease subunit [Trinickia diaoshuihuensis]